MWFIKVEFLDEFKALIDNYQNDGEIIKQINYIKAVNSFCKQGKGVSFYSRRVINSKLIKEIEKYKNDRNYREYSIKDL